MYVTTKSDGSKIVVVTNWGSLPHLDYTFEIGDIGLGMPINTKVTFTDVFDPSKTFDITEWNQSVSVGVLEKHQSRVYKVQSVKIESSAENFM